jgi:hypothetical protein
VGAPCHLAQASLELKILLLCLPSAGIIGVAAMPGTDVSHCLLRQQEQDGRQKVCVQTHEI